MLFSDRLEVWNPGQRPPPLTPETPRAPHASIPRNPLIAEPLFLAKYIEKAGSGILDLIALCADAGLLPPEFLQEGGQFIQRIWRLEAGGPSIRSVIDWGEGSTMSMLIALAARPSREA